MRILALSGSTRAGSYSTRVARLVADLRPADDVVVDADLGRLPFYDADVEAAGLPAPVAQLRRAVEDADLVVVVTPEYNGSVPGLVGNAVDWLSRPHRASVLRDRPVLVLGSSPSPRGGARGAAHLREVLAGIGARVLDEHLAVHRVHERLGAQPGAAPDPALVQELTAVLDAAGAAVPRQTVAA